MRSNGYQLLAISGSLRARSTNTEVLRAAALVAPPNIVVELHHGLGELPHFNPDLDVEGAVLPEPVQRLRAQVGAADALLICSPEYAHGVPGTLKNALDWLVSGSEIPYKPIGLLNASPRSTHAMASLAETLRTMSANLVAGGSAQLDLAARGLDAERLAAMNDVAEQLRSVTRALVQAADAYRMRRAELEVPGV